MFSRMVHIILAVNVIFLGSGREINLMIRDLKPVSRCYQGGLEATRAFLQSLGERPYTDANKIIATCLLLRVR